MPGQQELKLVLCNFGLEIPAAAVFPVKALPQQRGLGGAVFVPSLFLRLNISQLVRPNTASVENADGGDWASSHPRGEAGHLRTPMCK